MKPEDSLAKPAKALVAVYWDDASGSSAEQEDTEEDALLDHEPVVFVTVGFVLVDNEKGLTIYSEERLGQGSWRVRSFIPRGMIRQVTPIPWPSRRSRAGRPAPGGSAPTPAETSDCTSRGPGG